MVEVQIDKHIFNIDDTPTLEKYNEVIQQANDILKEVRENIYKVFLGTGSLTKLVILMVSTAIIIHLLKISHLNIILLVEFFTWFMICLLISEVFIYEIRSYIQQEIQAFKEKYKYIIQKH